MANAVAEGQRGAISKWHFISQSATTPVPHAPELRHSAVQCYQDTPDPADSSVSGKAAFF